MMQDLSRSLAKKALFAGFAFAFAFLPLAAASATLEDLDIEARGLEEERNRLYEQARLLRESLQRSKERAKRYAEDVRDESIYFVEVGSPWNVTRQGRAALSMQVPKEGTIAVGKMVVRLRLSESQVEELAQQLAMGELEETKFTGDAGRSSWRFFETYMQWMHQLKLASSELKGDLEDSNVRSVAWLERELGATTAAEEEVAEKLSRVLERRAAMTRGEIPQHDEFFVPVAIKLVAGSWNFGRSQNLGNPVDEFLCNIVLSTDYVDGKGYRLQSNHPNESYWNLDGESIVFFNDQGTPSTRFYRVGINHYQGA
ncbi:MAG: hypothetical protein H6Q05_4890, partial [Acidobacteria bacterium]|nr:hypothetical protein [Acidobacteriota bacterium]